MLYYIPQYKTTTLSVAGGIDASQTTGIILADIDGIDATKGGVACFSWADPLDTDTAEFITFTSVNAGTYELNGVTRGAEGIAAKAHANGVTVGFTFSKSHVNELNDFVLEEHDADGTHGAITPSTVVASTSVTTPAITATSAFPKVSGIKDLGTVGATETVSWANGDRQKMTLDENLTITFSNAAEGQTLTLYMLQDGAGTNTITWADTIVWQDNITWGTTYYSTTASKMNIAVITYVGSAYYGVISKFA